METPDLPSPADDKNEQSAGSEESECSECSCEACRNDDSVGDGARETLSFTNIKDPATAGVLTTPLVTQVFQSVSSVQPPGSITDAIEDLHARQARSKGKKQRHCSFCKLHGYLVNVKGHKPFCQFREKCTCKGCVLIRCNQQVSKSQVRLRRQKDMEVDMAQMTTCPAPLDAHFDVSDSFKKSPMCFKCWVHDSVRVRLKGHRNVCPYARCSCPNCVLNADRKRLTRELRQLGGGVRDKKSGHEMDGRLLSTGLGWPYIPSSPPSLHSLKAENDQANAGMFLSGKTTAGLGPACHYQGKGNSSAAAIPVRMHKAGDWPQLNTLLSSLTPNQGLRQEQSYLHDVLSGMSYNGHVTFSQSGRHNQPGISSGKWPSDMSSSVNPPSPFTSMSMNPEQQSGLSFTSDNFKCGMGSHHPTGNMQGNNMFGCFSQHSGCMVGQGTGTAVIQGNGSGCVAYPFCSHPCSPCHFPQPQHCQQSAQPQLKMLPNPQL
ncbi:uncharacterized protein [Littorina saxatilis]|uniref:DM domain-containing protein n=1 Tax=Littorina saxatilis TaxID=31220 RepID=A0AAN9GMW4_9CAEN